MAPRKDIEHYWPDRLLEANQRNLKRTKKETEKLLRKLYKEQSEELYMYLLDVFAKIAADKEDGKVYTNDLFLTVRYNQLIEYFNKCAQKIGGEQVKITEAALIKTYEEAQEEVDKYIPKDKVRTSFLVPSAITAEQAIRQTWCLDGKEFSDRIWKNKEALVKQLTKTMADFTAKGESPYKLSQKIVENLGADEYCAYRIARTETAHAQIKAQVDKYKEYGFTHGRFNATDPCDDCAALHGQLFTLDEIQTLIPKHPNCECSFLVEE